MYISNSIDKIKSIKNPVLTIGTFDGVHLGHQKILKRLNKEAENIEGESVLFTFYPHPRMVLFPESHNLKLLQTQAEKMEKLKTFGLQNIIVYPFTKEFSRLSALEFVRDFLVDKLKIKKIVIGYDHQFGKNREGTLEFLKEMGEIYDFEVIEIPAKEIDEINISSTKIRNALLSGDIETANLYLGTPFSITGKVESGKAIGRTLNYPTANLNVESETKIIPMNGVYAVKVHLPNNEIKNGMLNIGTNPTVGFDDAKKIEVHILDYDGDLYDKYITVELFNKIRDEQFFENLERLQEQLKKDEIHIRSFNLV